jgi:FMN phosphatase YigB (HAD superfamily)
MLIIFDLDDTLIDTSGCSSPIKFRIALQVMIKSGLAVTSEDAAFTRLMQLNEQTTQGKESLRLLVEELHGTHEVLDAGIKAYYGGKQLDFPVHPLPGALDLLQTLSAEHELFLVSYGVPKEQFGKMAKAGIAKEMFKKVVVTNEYNKGKSYLQLCNEFNVSPEQVIVIGDKYDTDLLPAKKLGMKTIHLAWGRGKQFPPQPHQVDYCIEDLQQVQKIVEEFS